MQNQNRRAHAGSSRRLAEHAVLLTSVIFALAQNVSKTFGDLVRELKASQSVLAAVIVELITDGWLTKNQINGRFVLTPRGADMVRATSQRQRGRQARRAA
jgi:DNA-binding IclR family transcriptional regulator